MAIFLALLSSGLWGTSDFCGGTLTRRLPALTVTAASELVGLSGVVVVAIATGSFGAPTGYIGWGLVGAIAGSIGIVAFYQALATGTMGVVAPIASLGVSIPLLVGLLQGDRPSVAQDAGIAIAIIGVVLAGGPEVQRGGGDRAALRPLLLAVVAAVGFGVVFVALDHGARSSTVMTLLVMRSAAVILMVAVAAGTSTSLRVGRVDVPMLVIVGLFDVGANATFAYATRHGLLSVVSVLSSLYPAVTVVLARAVHAERLARLQLFGVIGAMGGVALIAS
ncbi:MAG TPA: EamA family transporter [Mycobacteriales bacterium]|jgi:drug/metabolite transporter (DMT)-like permease|nr:EamA family transporter [Mycobacteriales bacterium]